MTAAAQTTTLRHLTNIQKGLPSLFSQTTNPYAPVAKWILGTSSLVAGMVHIGGVTRLTKSGLSMTDWRVLGSMPPRTTEQWNMEFNRYKTYPEWDQRKNMSLSEFQYIYYWEWGHRMMGRFVGVCFAVPWAYFALRKHSGIPPGYANRMKVLFAMGGTQGLVGWWMVQSGLGEDRRGDRKELRVSAYRLATHLGMAFSTYAVLLWTGLGILQFPNDHHPPFLNPSRLTKLMELSRSLSQSAISHAKRIRGGAMVVASLTAITIVSGAFVSGNDAGRAYNTYPKMDGMWIPPVEDMINPHLLPAYRNLFETTPMIQWNHRVLGTSTAVSAVTLLGLGMCHVGTRRALTPQVRRGLMVLGGVATGQMSLGIITLLNYVPIGLAAAHQIGSLVVWSVALYVVHSLRYVSPKLLRAVSGSNVGHASKEVIASGKKSILAVRQISPNISLI